MTALRRHRLVWLTAPPQADRADDAERAARWQARQRPFVVTRRRAPEDGVALGFCTVDPRHPGPRPRRVAARVEPGRIARSAPPPALVEIARCPAAGGHAAAFARLAAAADDAGLDLRVYGSWMWQALTGEPHVHDGSDLDLLVEVADAAAAEAACGLLAAVERALPFRLDGELSFPGRGEVQWREYGQGGAEVLLKAIDSLGLVPRAGLGA